MLESKVYQEFFALIRVGIGKAKTVTLSNADWRAIRTIAEQQGLYAIVLDGIEKLPEDIRPKQEQLLEWIGEVLQIYEYCYDAYKKAITEMAGFYNSHGFKMMILKGYACSLDWPKPEHRPCGDIDIWQFGDYQRADSCVAKEKKVEIDSSHHHHTVFNWSEFTVENHFDFVNVHANRSNAQLEMIFKELGKDDAHSIELYGEKVYLPSPNLHALFLLRHALIEFAATGLNLRQLLDWAFFVERHTKDIDWGWLEKTLDEYGMMPLYQLFNAICVEDLGFSLQLFPKIQFNPKLKDKVLAEILMPDQVSYNKLGGIPRLINRFLRWKDSAWKHELCYKESMWSAFWYGVWGHLLKPASI